tara:strand:- start:1840 stop:2484 length:645 start_codon:yes stop_codon:yes gene_type:complete
MKKSRVISIVVIFLLLIVVFASFLFGFFKVDYQKGVGSDVLEGFGENLPEDIDEWGEGSKEDLGIVSNRFSGGAGGGGSGGGGGAGAGTGAGTGGGQVCYDQQIGYAVKDFDFETSCNVLESGVCIDKSVNCWMNVHNLDSNVSGDFELEFLIDVSGAEEILDRESGSVFVEVNDFKYLSKEFNFVSSGVDGKANRDLRCNFLSVQIPTKQVCE